jgi:hypothetical protein
MTEKSHSAKAKGDESKVKAKKDEEVGSKFEDLDKPSEPDVFPEPTGTDSGASHSPLAAQAGSSGATTSSMMGANPDVDHGIEDKNFDKETGFWTGPPDEESGK